MKIECQDVFKLVTRKMHRVHTKWEKLSKAGTEPVKRQCLAMLYNGLLDVRDELPCKPDEKVHDELRVHHKLLDNPHNPRKEVSEAVYESLQDKLAEAEDIIRYEWGHANIGETYTLWDVEKIIHEIFCT